jgi:hypothetical protein
VFVRLVKATSERLQISTAQKKMFGSTGTIVTDLGDGFVNVKHETCYCVWHENSLAEDHLATNFGIKP